MNAEIPYLFQDQERSLDEDDAYKDLPDDYDEDASEANRKDDLNDAERITDSVLKSVEDIGRLGA